MNNRENEEFTAYLRQTVREAERLKYVPRDFKKMIERDGGYETVKRILASGRPSEGFVRLEGLRRVDLTCEAIIVETKWRAYFDDDLLERSEKLLGSVRYAFTRFDTSEPNEPADHGSEEQDEFEPPESDHRDHAQREVALRPWQGQFRDALFERYGVRCCVSGCEVAEALEAAHITPYLGEKSNDTRNGFVLRSDLHTLFDRYLFSVNPATLVVTLSAKLLGDASYKSLQGKALQLASAKRPSARALMVHWKAFAKHSDNGRERPALQHQGRRR